MTIFPKQPDTYRTLAFSPYAGGFGYVVIEGPMDLIDWGVKHISHHKDRDDRLFTQAKELMHIYQPNRIVLPKFTKNQKTTRLRGTKLIKRIQANARHRAGGGEEWGENGRFGMGGWFWDMKNPAVGCCRMEGVGSVGEAVYRVSYSGGSIWSFMR